MCLWHSGTHWICSAVDTNMYLLLQIEVLLWVCILSPPLANSAQYSTCFYAMGEATKNLRIFWLIKSNLTENKNLRRNTWRYNGQLRCFSLNRRRSEFLFVSHRFFMQQAFKTCRFRCVFGTLEHIGYVPPSTQTCTSCFKLKCYYEYVYYHHLLPIVHIIAHASMQWERQQRI